jgi:HEAT repeat protein
MPLFGPPNVEKLEAKRDIKGLGKALSYKKNRGVRSQAVYALLRIGNRQAVEPLIAALKDEDGGIRFVAAEALGKIGDARAVEPLIVALKDENEPVRYFSAEALGKIRDPRAVRPLIAALNDKSETVHRLASVALDKIGASGLEPLIAALKDENLAVRGYAARALGKIGDARAVQPLIAALKNDEDEGVRYSADVALVAYVNDPLAKEARAKHNFDTLIECIMKGPSFESGYDSAGDDVGLIVDWSNMINAIKQLGLLGNPGAIPALIECKENRYSAGVSPPDYVVREIEEAISRIRAQAKLEHGSSS